MFKAIIVDDEPVVCQLIQKLINWDELGIELIDQAEDGLGALELIIRHKPDIVITDIRMPGIDGLELVKRTREKSLDTNFVIISGHKHFDYAFKAIKYGVEDYLLKPVDQNELNHVLEQICTRLSKKNNEEIVNRQLEDKLEMSLGRLKARALDEMIEKKSSVQTLKELNNLFQCQFTYRVFQCLNIKLDANRELETISKEEIHIILNKIGDLLGNQLTKDGACLERFIYNDMLFCMVNYRADLAETIQKELRRLYSDIFSLVELYYNFAVTMGIGDPVDDVATFYDAVASAREAIYARIALGTNRLIYAKELPETADVDPFDQNGNAMFSELEKIVEAYDVERVNGWITGIFKTIRGKNISVYKKMAAYEALLKRFFSVFEEFGMQLEDYPTERKEEMQKSIYGFARMDDVEWFVQKAMADYFKACLSSKLMQRSRPIREAKKFIENHYQEKLTLELVAAKVYLSPIYLSVMFKNEEGVNFNKYLTVVRINKAKEYLKDIEYSIAEIADMVGYKDAKHFSKLFKKFVGINPNEYRKLHA